MNQEIYQSSDQPQPNPISSQPSSNLPKIPKIKLNPKIIILLSLFSLVFLLFFISLFVKKTPTPVSSPPTPTQIPVTQITPQLPLPSAFQPHFDQIDQLNQQSEIIPPPIIDQTIGQ